MKKIRSFLGILKRTFISFDEDEGMKLSASLSYYTLFSIAPFLVIVIAVASSAFGREAVEGKVYYQISNLVGHDAALQVQNIMANVQLKDQGVWGTIIGSIILILGATGVFTEIQGSINYIWSVRAKPKKGLLKLIINRLISFSLVVSVGFILLVSLLLNSLMDIFYARLEHMFTSISVQILYGTDIWYHYFIIHLYIQSTA
jgi:membrane protein